MISKTSKARRRVPHCGEDGPAHDSQHSLLARQLVAGCEAQGECPKEKNQEQTGKETNGDMEDDKRVSGCIIVRLFSEEGSKKVTSQDQLPYSTSENCS